MYTAPWVHVVPEQAGLPVDLLLPRTGTAFVTRLDGREMRDTDSVFQQFYDGLRLPDHFGWNWNALLDCLRDLAWLPADHYVLIVQAADEALLVMSPDVGCCSAHCCGRGAAGPPHDGRTARMPAGSWSSCRAPRHPPRTCGNSFGSASRRRPRRTAPSPGPVDDAGARGRRGDGRRPPLPRSASTAQGGHARSPGTAAGHERDFTPWQLAYFGPPPPRGDLLLFYFNANKLRGSR